MSGRVLKILPKRKSATVTRRTSRPSLQRPRKISIARTRSPRNDGERYFRLKRTLSAMRDRWRAFEGRRSRPVPRWPTYHQGRSC